MRSETSCRALAQPLFCLRHVKEKYEYKPEFGVHIYGDDWKWADADHDKYRWREHEGRGYWNKGVWIGF